MNNKVVISVFIGALLVVGGAVFLLQSGSQEVVVPSEQQQEEMGYIPTLVHAKHQFEDGVHTIAGEIDLPTPCYLLKSDVFVEIQEPETDRVLVQFTTTGEAEICAQVITPARFKEAFHAQENAHIEATWNGKPVMLNLVEVGPEENLDDFELFLKG